MKAVKIGILGLGTVGGGVVNVLNRNSAEILRRSNCKIIVSRACVRDLNRHRSCDTQGINLTTNAMDIINDPEIDIILELVGGNTLQDLILPAIEQGKHIVTANKALIAEHGNEIFKQAYAKKVMVLFESTVAAGIPIVKVMREGLSAHKIKGLAGIINGTANFILTEMQAHNRDFNDALAQATALGYAEADPTFDIEGIDAAHKLTILASLAFGIPLQFKQVFSEGIRHITRADIQYAQQLGYRIKQLGIAKKSTQGIEMRVHPALLPEHCLIARVEGVMNAILVQSDIAPTLYYGAGAGAEPTASAVVADIIDVVRTLTGRSQIATPVIPSLSFQADSIVDLPVLSHTQITTAYYLRLQVKDKPKALQQITQILDQYKISIAKTLTHKEPPANEAISPIVILTQPTLEKQMNAVIIKIEALSTVTEPVCKIRLETLE